MSKELLQLGWRSVGKRGLAFEPFCEPAHKVAIAKLTLRSPLEVAGIGQLRWSVDEQGKLRALDETKGVPRWFVQNVSNLADMVVHDMARLLENMHAMEIEEVTSHAAQMLVEHDVEVSEAILAGTMTLDGTVQIFVDRGSPIATVAPTTPEQESREYDDDGRLVRATFTVPGLPSAVVQWDASFVRVTLPGVPATSPLAGWTKPEVVLGERVRQIVLSTVVSLLTMGRHLPFGQTANALAR